MAIEVTFFTENEALRNAMQPVPASEFWPSWFKSQQGGTGWSGTVKNCPAVLDVVNMGYIIPLWSDYKVVRSHKLPDGIGWTVPDPDYNPFGASLHPKAQMTAYPFGPDTWNGTFKFYNPWLVKTPPGYSCYVCAPHYNKHPNFEVLNGVIDTDIYHELHVNTLFTAPLDQEIDISFGTPIVQIIPFRREQYKMDVKLGDHRSKASKLKHFLHSVMFKKTPYRPKLTQKNYK